MSRMTKIVHSMMSPPSKRIGRQQKRRRPPPVPTTKRTATECIARALPGGHRESEDLPRPSHYPLGRRAGPPVCHPERERGTRGKGGAKTPCYKLFGRPPPARVPRSRSG